MPQKIIDSLNAGIQLLREDKFRRGNLISLPAVGNLIVTGDIHGHRRNFERICTFADLDNNPDNHVLLQEIIHGGPQDPHGGCLSYKLLFDVVDYKLKFPDRVHIIMGNHDTIFINDGSVIKDGVELNRSMTEAIDRQFGAVAEEIKYTMKQFLLSLPLAVRCENRIWLSHSLPNDRYVDKFDSEILDGQLKAEDLLKPGSAYLLTWGRNHTQPLLDRMAQLLDVDIFVLGHQPQEQGWTQAGDNLIIIASNHNHGCLLPVDLGKSYTIDEMIDSIVPLASIS